LPQSEVAPHGLEKARRFAAAKKPVLHDAQRYPPPDLLAQSGAKAFSTRQLLAAGIKKSTAADRQSVMIILVLRDFLHYYLLLIF
jgi:hypothetical protein